MKGTLVLNTSTLAYADPLQTSNPIQRYVDWGNFVSLAVENPAQVSGSIDPGATKVIFDGTVTTSINNLTEFDLTLSVLSPIRYRMTWSGTGANPAFRTDRGLALSGVACTFTVNPNFTASFAATSGDFASVSVGDWLFIPNSTTGDTTSPFDTSNTGWWIVLSKNGTDSTIQLYRPQGTDFSAVNEIVTPTLNSQVIAYSSAGVQIGQNVAISDGFSAPVRNTYEILQVTPTWFEFEYTGFLPATETAVPTMSGIAFYSNAKRYVRVMVQQQSVIQINGDTTDVNRISPWTAGDAVMAGEFLKNGPTWSLSIVNKSTSTLDYTVISAE